MPSPFQIQPPATLQDMAGWATRPLSGALPNDPGGMRAGMSSPLNLLLAVAGHLGGGWAAPAEEATTAAPSAVDWGAMPHPPTTIGAPSAMRAADPLFTPNEQGAMGEVQRIYKNYFGKPVNLGLDTRDTTMDPARRWLGQYDNADPDLREHVRNAFIAGMKHSANILPGGK